MDRRTFIRTLPAWAACVAGGGLGVWEIRRRLTSSRLPSKPSAPIESESAAAPALDPVRDEGARERIPPHADSGHVDHLQKIKDFDRVYSDDFRLAVDVIPTLESASARIERAQRLVGHGNFNLLSFDQLLKFAANYAEIGAFPKAELDLLDELFNADAALYGFFGDKVITDQTERIPDRAVAKIAGSGHYLLKGDSLEKFTQIRREVGSSIALTSGVRSIVKQYQLFLRKAVETEGNLSRASRSLAPPGYSFHARGDFDIGKVGYGPRNFTEEFGRTLEFRKLIDLGFISIRYTETNPYGVRHEPWHIKIA